MFQSIEHFSHLLLHQERSISLHFLTSHTNITDVILLILIPSKKHYFSEIVGKKKDLFEGLEIPFPEPEMNIEYEEDAATEAED